MYMCVCVSESVSLSWCHVIIVNESYCHACKVSDKISSFQWKYVQIQGNITFLRNTDVMIAKWGILVMKILPHWILSDLCKKGEVNINMRILITTQDEMLDSFVHSTKHHIFLFKW